MSNTLQPCLTLAEAATLAEHAMDACNLSGLAHDFPRIMETVWDDVRSRGGGTDQANTHPLAVLWLVKMAELAGLWVDDRRLDSTAIRDAFAWLRAHRDKATCAR
jgi:hypothetical protein